MILSYRKRATSPSADCQIIPNPGIRVQARAAAEDSAQVLQIKNETPSTVGVQARASPSKARRNTPFASFFQNLFVANTSSNVNANRGPTGGSSTQEWDPSSRKDEPGCSSKNRSEGRDQDTDARRDSSYHNEAYVFSSPSPSCSSSAESINTVLSTNSFAFVHPKKYGGKKRHGKRIPIDIDGDESPREPVPVKLKVQHAQPLPNSRRKKLSTLSRLGMKIGLKSKYNLQSCESLQSATAAGSRSGSIRRVNEKGYVEGGHDGKDKDTGRGQSSKRRAPLPPSASAHGHRQAGSSRNFRLPPAPSASAVLHNYNNHTHNHHESVQLKSVTSLGSFDRLPPTPKSKPTSGSDHSGPISNSPAVQSQTQQPQHRRYHSDGHHGHAHAHGHVAGGSRSSASAARVYHHVRGKRKAPVPPVRLTTVTKTVASEDERIIQSILNVKPPAAAATLPVAADEAKGNIGASSPTAACRYPWRNQNSNSSRLRLGLGCSPNMATTATATPAAGPRQQQQLESLEESSLHSPKTNTRTRTIDDAASASQTHSQAQPRKSAITATLGCYESFEEDDDDDEHGHLSTNSLLVHEKRQNEQVRSQLTKANGLSNNGVNCASPSSTSSAVPALPSTSKTTTTSTSKMSFSFFKRNTDKENGRAQHATAASSTVPTTHSQASNSNAVSQNQIAETNPTTTPSLAGVTVVKLAPRPWYKRSSKDKANTTGCVTTGAGSVTPNRAKPSISVLTNISELDRQAAEIVEEKRRRSAIEQNESAKKLISMFNRAFSAQSPSSSKDQDLSPSSSSAQSTNSNYANAVTLPSGAGSSGAGPPSGGLDERKKLAIVQPQANTNYKAQTRPVSTPTTPSMLVGNSILGPRPPGILGAETSASSSTADWSCPRCTLQNAHWRSFCDACHFRQGSTLVHSIASMFEASGQNQTPERRGSGTERSSTTSRPPAEDQAAGQSVAIATAAQSATTTCSTSQTTNANTTAPGSSMELPPENLLCHTKDKSEKDKKLDGIKLHADDPEVEELDLEKLREARLAFFARHKVSSPPTATATASSVTSTNTKLSSGSQKSAVVDNLKKKPSKFPVTICNSNDLNQFLPRDRADADPERQRENDNSGSAEESEEDYPASTAFSTPKWKPFSPQKKTCLDPTYENWHLKLSELDIDGDGDDDDTVAVTANFNQSTRNSAFIRNISSEIKDQLDYFDRLKSQLRRQRSPGDGLDDSEFSESDASTVIDAANFDVIMENRRLRQLQLEERRGPQLHFGAATGSSSASARRRISLGDPIPNSNSPPSSSRPFLHRNGAGPTTAPVSSSGHSSYRSFERRDHDDRHRFQEFRENESRPRSHSHQPQPAFYHRNGVQAQVQASGSERRQQNRALEHSASAISKQLRKLEWAINVGDHKLAASLAHDLAILKASCNKVPEERTSQPHPITIRVYVEDRFMQQGPFQVPVTAATTVHELKSKIERDWGIPVLFQKWILGRKIAEDEGQTLAAYEVVHDSMAFLYLVTPNNGKSQEKDGGSSSSSEDSVQIMAITHLAKSPPVSRKISPEVAIASKDDRGTKEVAAGSASCTLSEPDKISTSLAVKHESASAKTAQNLPKAEPEPPSTSPMVSAPSGGNNSQQETTTTASVGVPKSNKTVTSKYIESIRQTNSEEPPLSPENSILKQNIHGEKVGKAKQVPVTSPQQPPLSPSTRRKLTQKDTTKDQVRRSAVRVERLLETSTELSRKANSQAIQRQQQPIQTAATGGAKNVGAELPETSSEETRRERAKANEIRHTKPNFSPVLKHELPTLNPKTGTGTASMPSVEVQAVVMPLSSFNEKPLVGQSQRKAATQGRVEPVQAAPVIRPLVKSPGAELAPKHSNGAPHIQVQGPLNKDPEPQSPEQVNNADGKSKSRNRWNPQPQASSSKNVEVLDQILIRRKDSDAIDINLQVQETAAKSVGSSLSSPSGAAAAGGATIPDKEDNTETYRKMLQLMENEDCVRNTEELDCPVCFSRVGVGDGVTLRDCLHCFCRECLAGTIQYSDEPQVKCPFRDASYSCESFLQEREIKGLVSPTMFERHLAQAVKLAENKIANTFHCKTNDCTGWCIFEDDVNVFKCPVCRKSNCLTCQAIHEGKNCQEYQRELAINAETDEGAKSSRIMLEKMIQRGEALECPACHVVLLKKWGCDWVRCSYCKTEICWVTKSFRWGKNGKGDTSGGCRCGVNGVKCHPKCTYCH